MNNKRIEDLGALINTTAQKVRSLEKQAADSLQIASKGKKDYEAKMLAKCSALIELSEKANELIGEPLTDEERRLIKALQDIARRAKEALAIGSSFYMSSLLYSEKDGPNDPNELEHLMIS